MSFSWLPRTFTGYGWTVDFSNMEEEAWPSTGVLIEYIPETYILSSDKIFKIGFES